MFPVPNSARIPPLASPYPHFQAPTHLNTTPHPSPLSSANKCASTPPTLNSSAGHTHPPNPPRSKQYFKNCTAQRSMIEIDIETEAIHRHNFSPLKFIMLLQLKCLPNYCAENLPLVVRFLFFSHPLSLFALRNSDRCNNCN